MQPSFLCACDLVRSAARPYAHSRASYEVKTISRLQFFGLACLGVVILTHVAEKLHVFPRMGWGLPDSPGHYLDLVSAILGATSLLAAFALRNRRASKATHKLIHAPVIAAGQRRITCPAMIQKWPPVSESKPRSVFRQCKCTGRLQDMCSATNQPRPSAGTRR